MSLMLARRAVIARPRMFRGLLDDYPGAAAAYSLRPLSAAWRTQPVVRVLRSNDDAEADFTAAEVADGTLTAWTGANDGFVVTWYDQSGEGRNATQATAANQPRIVDAGVVEMEGGRPAIYFDTTFLTVSTSPLRRSWTKIGVYRIMALDSGLFTNSGFRIQNNMSTSLRIRSGDGFNATGIGGYNQQSLYTLQILSSPNARARTNRGVWKSGNNYTDSPSSGGLTFGVGGPHRSVWQEAVFYNNLDVYDGPEINLANHYGITLP